MLRPPPRVTGVTELIDGPCAERSEMERTLKDLAWINRFLGGERVVVRALSGLVERPGRPVRILDVATGYADLPRAIVRWARRRGIEVKIEALDRNPQALELAVAASAGYPEIRFRQADALRLPYRDLAFDIALASLVLHHMEGPAVGRLLQELHRVASRGVVVNDLRRGRWPYLVTWLCLHLVSRNRLIHHDGPLSIRRGFLEGELRALAEGAGWNDPRVSRSAFFRLALVERLG
jgi:2-polyprenyl-3-methyl-5-hydroxy-6-metoxy-1,4-benzoquinol methylase